jgi:hypothetical protein
MEERVEESANCECMDASPRKVQIKFIVELYEYFCFKRRLTFVDSEDGGDEKGGGSPRLYGIGIGSRRATQCTQESLGGESQMLEKMLTEQAGQLINWQKKIKLNNLLSLI